MNEPRDQALPQPTHLIRPNDAYVTPLRRVIREY